MEVLAHRGWWTHRSETNSIEALLKAVDAGYGIETDIRDYDGQLVISHDVPDSKSLPFSEFVDVLCRRPRATDVSFAWNIKSDGLHSLFSAALPRILWKKSFVFDMSVPDMRGYFSIGSNVFTRLSEFEKEPSYLDQSQGIWLDAFDGEWFGANTVIDLRQLGKSVCIVSSELHGRDHADLWDMLKSIKDRQGLMLCTDFPADAESFFEG